MRDFGCQVVIRHFEMKEAEKTLLKPRCNVVTSILEWDILSERFCETNPGESIPSDVRVRILFKRFVYALHLRYSDFFLYIIRDPLNCKTDPLVHMYVYKNISREFIKVFFFYLFFFIKMIHSMWH